MASFWAAASDVSHVELTRRGRRWVPRSRWRYNRWKLAVECVGMTVLASTIVYSGGLAGFYLSRSAFDLQSRRFATSALSALMSSWDRGAIFDRASPEFVATSYESLGPYLEHFKKYAPGMRARGCVGRATYNPFAPRALVIAKYICEIDVRNKVSVATIGLRKAADDWQVTKFYISPPTVSRR